MDKRVLELARALHIARIESCYFPTGNLTPDDKGYYSTVEAALQREPFPPVNTKEFRTMNHHGQAYIDIAVDQAKAVLKHLKEQNNG